MSNIVTRRFIKIGVDSRRKLFRRWLTEKYIKQCRRKNIKQGWCIIKGTSSLPLILISVKSFLR